VLQTIDKSVKSKEQLKHLNNNILMTASPASHPLSTSFMVAHQTEADLAEKLLNGVFGRGDEKAFQELFRIFYKPLCRYCRKFVNTMDVAEEVVGDVFYAIWKNRARYEIQTSAISYLFTATRNRAYDHLRKLQRDRSVELERAAHITTTEPSCQDTLEANEIQSHLQEAINLLPTSCRKIFQMSRDLGMKYQEIADALGLSIKTVETQMGRALKQIRLHYEYMEP
jgi:RNA polymerase sigma-70 factor (ECF subfamily)